MFASNFVANICREYVQQRARCAGEFLARDLSSALILLVLSLRSSRRCSYHSRDGSNERPTDDRGLGRIHFIARQGD